MTIPQLVELVGFACLVAAGFLVALPVGIAVVGLGLLASGVAFDRGDG